MQRSALSTMSCPQLSTNLSSVLQTPPTMSLSNIIPCCVPFRPPSTAMTVGIPPVEAECLHEDRKGGNVHPAHTFTRMYIQIPKHFLVYISNCMYSLKVPPPLVFLCVKFSIETPGKSISVPEELVAYGHSRTPSHASQHSKISGTKHIYVFYFLLNQTVYSPRQVYKSKG